MNAFLAHRSLIVATRKLGRYKEAMQYALRFEALSNRHPHSVFDLLEIHAAMGESDKAEKLFEELKTRSKTHYINSTYMALAAADCNDIELAFHYFEKASSERDVMLLTIPHIIYHSVPMLMEDPRFRELVNVHNPEKSLAEMA
jgi:tetratricopeptide (TPR) repeat protein